MADKQRIFVISDLHLGDGGPRDSFAWGDREKQFGLFLDYVAQKQGELIVLGDLFEFWQMNPSKIVVRNKPLLDRLAAMSATYVVGNHDTDIEHFIGTGLLSHPLFEKLSRPFEREIGGKRFKFMHGHEVDPFNSGDTPGKGRICAILAGMREDKNGSPVLPNGEFVEDHLEEIGDILEAIAGHIEIAETRLTGWWNRLRPGGQREENWARHLTPAQNPDLAKQMLALYYEDMEDCGYDVLIAGHTHHPGRIGDWYFNSGTWARKKNSFIQISAAGKAAVFDWVDGRLVRNRTALEM